MKSNLDYTIKRVEAIPVSLPLIKPVLMGDNQEIRSSDSLLVRLETVGGVIGWGEASAAPKMTGETLLGMKQLVDTQFSQMLVGQSIVDWAMVNDQIQKGYLVTQGQRQPAILLCMTYMENVAIFLFQTF